MRFITFFLLQSTLATVRETSFLHVYRLKVTSWPHDVYGKAALAKQTGASVTMLAVR